MPILCSIEPQDTALRSPRLPSSLTINLGTRNNEIPRGPAGASGSLASTRWMMFSVRSCSPPVMKILVPVMRKLPSAWGSALVRMMPKSVPAWGSVRHMEPAHWPLYMLGRYFCFSSSLAWALSDRQAPAVSIGNRPKEILAALTISSSWAVSILGMPMPSYSGAPPTPTQPPSA